MTVLSWLFCIFNIFFAVVSFVPCIMGGAMGMDSPQAQKDPFSIAMCILFLTFPLICLICAFACPLLQHFKFNILSFLVGIFPVCHAATVIGSLIIFGKN